MNAWRKMHASISSFMSFQGFGIVTAVFCSFYRSSGDLRVVATGSECGIWPYNCNFWFTVFLNTYLHVPESSRHPTREQRSSIVTGSLRDGLHHPCDRSRSEEHTSELQSLMRISYSVFCLKKKKQ